jgi:hypothetical protein
MLFRIQPRALLLSISSLLAGSVIINWLSLSGLDTISDRYAVSNEGLALDGGRRSSIGKVMMLYGNPTPVYERALRCHDKHDAIHGYITHVLREQTLSEFWSKPAYILQLLLAELAKPGPERLKWLVYVYLEENLGNDSLTWVLPSQLARWRCRYHEPLYSAGDFPPSRTKVVAYQRTRNERPQRSQQRRLLPPSERMVRLAHDGHFGMEDLQV